MEENKDIKMTHELRQAVADIKAAILQGQYEACKGVNRIQLAVYFGIGKYVSQHSRKGTWGMSALEVISNQLRRELPGLRGYSATSLRNMRKFYENWIMLDGNSASALAELQSTDNQHENPSIGIVLCKSANREYVEFMIRDYSKPMGVATYKTADEMPENLRKALPDMEELKKLI